MIAAPASLRLQIDVAGKAANSGVQAEQGHFEPVPPAPMSLGWGLPPLPTAPARSHCPAPETRDPIQGPEKKRGFGANTFEAAGASLRGSPQKQIRESPFVSLRCFLFRLC